MAKEAKNEPKELTVEEKLKTLFNCRLCCLKLIRSKH
jgi:hypothetical protein